MARRRSFFDKVVQKVKRDSNNAWTKDSINIYSSLGRRLTIDADISHCSLVGDKLMGTLQQEALVRLAEEEYYFQLDREPPEPPLFPGLMLAWEELPVTVTIDDKLIEHARAQEANFAFTPLDKVRTLFPACLLIDVRNRDVEFYGKSLDAVFVYPSYDTDRKYELLLIVGINLRMGLYEPFCSKYVMHKPLLGEAVEHTIEERERIRKRVMSETDYGDHDMIFSPYEDEEKVMLLVTETLGLMFWDGATIDRVERNKAMHLHVRCRKDGEVNVSETYAPAARKAPLPAPSYVPKQKPPKDDKRKRKQEQPEVAQATLEEQLENTSTTHVAGAEAVSEGAHKQTKDARIEDAQHVLSEHDTLRQTDIQLLAEQPAETQLTISHTSNASLDAEQPIELQQEAEQPDVYEHPADAKPRSQPSPSEGEQPRIVLPADVSAQRRSTPSKAERPGSEQPSDSHPTDHEHASSFEEELMDENARLESELHEAKAKASSLSYHLRQTNEALKTAQSTSAAVRTRAEVLESMEIPTSPDEALKLAERAFADRLVILDQAHRSAREFVRGNTGEVWAVLRSMAMVLHPMIFGQTYGNVVYAFQAQTGFEVALREMKLAKSTKDFVRLRTVTYKGAKHYASAHVKGRGRARGESLRVHFFADYDENRLVIAHCGEHLTTFDTASL